MNNAADPVPQKTHQQRDLAVCYRIYPRVTGNPIFGFINKLALVQLNLESFKSALGNLRTRIWFLLDNCPPDYENLIRSLFPADEIEIISLTGDGNAKTFGRQIDLLMHQTDADLVYFAEDDYLYLPGSIEQTVALFKENPCVDFATLYDHLDYRYLKIHRPRNPQEKIISGSCWRTVTSTCLTFMTRRDVLRQTAKTLQTYRKGNTDLGVWLALTKIGVINPAAILRSFSDGRFCTASYLFAWWYAAKQTLLGKRYTLWAPEPSLATHMEMSGLAPDVDWNTRFACRAKELQAI